VTAARRSGDVHAAMNTLSLSMALVSHCDLREEGAVRVGIMVAASRTSVNTLARLIIYL